MPSDFQQLCEYLWVKQNNPFATNTGLLIRAGQACLLDPGISPDNLTEIKRFVADQDAEVKTVILTHAHWDHLLGAAWFPHARVVAHKHYLDVIKNHGGHLAQQVTAWWVPEAYGPLDLWTPPEPTTVFSHTMVLHIGDISLRLIHTPGHTVDHSVVYMPQERILWAGDLLSDRELPLVEDLNAYVRTLVTLAALDVRMLVPGHGTPAAEAGDIHTRFDQDRTYLHTLRTCVLDSLACGCDDVQTVNACLKVPFAQPDDYPNAHRWNIESAYRSLGGTSTGLGWDNEWL